MTIYLCENSLEGIMTGVYDAYAGKPGHENVKLQLAEEMEQELFAEYVEVQADGEKAEKVLRTIRRRLGGEAFEAICQAAASWDNRKADAIYRTIVLGLQLSEKDKVMHCLTKDYVCTVAALAKKAWNEAHRFMGFVRFRELSGGILYSEIRPENDILPLIAPHFANRYPEENWIIYDERREKSVAHSAGGGWAILENGKIAEEAKKRLSAKEDDYQALWKTFTKSIAIEARKNEKLQKQLLPLKFRDKMNEFKQ